MSGQWHPDAEAVASFRAGLVGGFRRRRLAAHLAACPRCASVSNQLDEISSALAAVPAAPLPAAFERQITAAIAAEAAARASAATESTASPALVAVGDGDGQGSADRGPAAHRPAPSGRRHRPRSRRFRLAIALSPALACLLAGGGYLASQAASGPIAATAAAPNAASGTSSQDLGPANAPAAVTPGHRALSQPYEEYGTTFSVISSGVSYRQATLRAQVLDELAVLGTQTPVPSTAPSSSFGGGTTAPAATSAAPQGTVAVPSQALLGCVLHLTGGVAPRLVDKATYQGAPAYVIAVSDRAWVVGRGCTASKPELITSVSLVAAAP